MCCANGGGNDEMWIEGIPSLLRQQALSAGRRTTANASWSPTRLKHSKRWATSSTASVETWIPPQPDNPLRFTGQGLRAGGPRHPFIGEWSSAMSFRISASATVAGVGNSVRAAHDRRHAPHDLAEQRPDPRLHRVSCSHVRRARPRPVPAHARLSKCVIFRSCSRSIAPPLTTALASAASSMLFIRLMA